MCEKVFYAYNSITSFPNIYNMACVEFDMSEQIFIMKLLLIDVGNRLIDFLAKI